MQPLSNDRPDVRSPRVSFRSGIDPESSKRALDPGSGSPAPFKIWRKYWDWGCRPEPEIPLDLTDEDIKALASDLDRICVRRCPPWWWGFWGPKALFPVSVPPGAFLDSPFALLGTSSPRNKTLLSIYSNSLRKTLILPARIFQNTYANLSRYHTLAIYNRGF